MTGQAYKAESFTPVGNPVETVYKATHTGSKFHKSDAFVRLIMGPIGSGKSVACCWEVFLKACAQKPTQTVSEDRDGLSSVIPTAS